MQIGSVVYSTAGRDKHRFYAVVGTQKDKALIADGKGRKLAAPKTKNLLHLRPTKTVLNKSALQTDKQLRMALAPLNNRESVHSQKEGGTKLV